MTDGIIKTNFQNNSQSGLLIHASADSLSSLTLEDLIESSICNHQKCKITFKEGGKGVLCDVVSPYMGCSQTNVAVAIGVLFNLTVGSARNPFNYTFYPHKKTLALHSHGLSGGVPLLETLGLENWELSGRMSDALPRHTYTSIIVNSTTHSFSGLRDPGVPTKVITLDITSADYYKALIYSLFAGLGLVESGDINQPIDRPQLQDDILQILRREGEVDDTQLNIAFANCTTIDLFISRDAESIEMRLRNPSEVLAVYKTAKILSHIIPILYANAQRR